ncbi:hypothetical protein [Pelosinus sp. IPA-1]|uniref:hypothetical protein n=1 Tax=Pelosinus sp. IPA-1 TaxID=3029569 RepID=UPI00243625FD|nr:hypothetical protein [Pelosinus sp. IPA-1]GMB01189.1 hypothetical protein PIPA1_39880 [Pelosinus sp. IPA-1]
MKHFGLRILLVLSLLIGFGTTGSVWAATSNEAPSANIKVDQWVGNSFTFLTLPAEKQAAGYEIFKVDQATQGLKGDNSVRIPYAQHVGKQVKVTEVVPFAAGYHQQEYMVYMTVKDTGEKLVGRTMRGQLEGLVLTSDLDNARQQFLGKTIYPKFRELSGLYDPYETPVTVATIIGAPVTVVDVYAGNQSQEPIWLIVSVNGEKAILPIAYSWTNIPVQSWTQTPPWQDALFTEDPRISLGWSGDLWSKIEKGIVEEGMTKGEILLSWGKPVRIEEDDSVWIYGTKKLSFDGDVLNSIETFSESK